MIEKVKIEKIYFNATNKDQQPYLDKEQRPYEVVKVVSGGRTLWGRAYQNSPIKKLRAGSEVELDVEKNDKGYENFRLPKGAAEADTSKLQETIKILEQVVQDHEQRLKWIEAGAPSSSAISALKSADEIDPESLPF